MPDLVIRPINADDRAAWTPLWADYLVFNQQQLPPETTDFSWDRLTRIGGFDGFLAVSDHRDAIGFIHYLNHASTSSHGGNCYIEDLYVAPSARGRGVARQLIDAVIVVARRDGARRVYWHTAESNAVAQRLYERIAKRAALIRYEIDLRSPQDDQTAERQ